jgi:hypothetical protein
MVSRIHLLDALHVGRGHHGITFLLHLDGAVGRDVCRSIDGALRQALQNYAHSGYRLIIHIHIRGALLCSDLREAEQNKECHRHGKFESPHIVLR